MSEWRGLHNPERHGINRSGVTACISELDGCGCHCYADQLCPCCLESEVEALTARAEKAEAALARVREACDEAPLAWQEEPGDEPVPCVYVPSILEALDPDE